MPFFMEQDKPFDPGDIRFFGSNGIVLHSNEGSHLIQQLDRGAIHNDSPCDLHMIVEYETYDVYVMQPFLSKIGHNMQRSL